MRTKLLTPWMFIIFFLCKVVDNLAQFDNIDDYIEDINRSRQKVMDLYKLSHVRKLINDAKLAEKAATLPCSPQGHSIVPPQGYRMFFAPEDDAARDWVNHRAYTFLMMARDDIEQAIRYLGNYPGAVEVFSVNQKRIGCAWQKCQLIDESDGAVYNTSVICLLGPKGTLTAEDLPFELPKAHTGVTVVHDFGRYIEAINERRLRILNDHNVPGNGKLIYVDELEKVAESLLLCPRDPPNGYRIFWIPRDYKAFKFFDDQMKKFLDIAHSDVDQGIHHVGFFPNQVEYLSVAQSRVGCVWRGCTWTANGVVYNHTGICVLGEGTLKAENLPFRRGEKLPEEL